MNRNHTYAYLMLIICVFSWGSVFPVAKEILTSMSGLSLAFWRFVLAVSVITSVLMIRRQPMTGLTPARTSILLLVGVIGIGGFNFGLFTGLRQTAAINGSLIMAMSPLINLLLDALIRRQALKSGQIFSLLMGFAGVLLVITDGDVLSLQINQGDIWIISGMLCWSFYTLAAKATAGWLPPLFFTLLTMAGGCAALLMVVILQQETPLQQLQSLSAVNLSGVLYIGLFATVFGYLLWNRGIAALGVSTASLFFNLVPVFAALTGLFYGQHINPVQLTGMVIVLTGLMAPALWRRINPAAITQA